MKKKDLRDENREDNKIKGDSVKKKTKLINNVSDKMKVVVANNEKQEEKNITQLLRNSHLINYLVIIGVSLFYFLVILDGNTFYDAHDLDFHASNMIAIASDLSLTHLLPSKILPMLVNNLGYGVNIFYPCFPHLVGAYIYKVLGSIPLTFMLLSFILINLAGILMYKFVDKIFKNKQQALMTAVTYISIPYFFADLFIRCALNESFLFVLIPLILLGIHYLIDDNNKFMFYILFVVGYVLAINSHLVMSVYLTMVLIIYLLFLRKKVFKIEVIKSFVMASVFIILLTLNFTVPLIEHQQLGIYNIFNIEYTGQSLVKVAYIINYLLPVAWLDVPMYIPVLVMAALLYVFLNIKEVKTEHKMFLKSMFAILAFSLILAIVRPVWNLFPNILRNIQFGWRMSVFVVVVVSILFGYVVNLLREDFKKLFVIDFILIFAFTNFLSSFLIVREDIKEEGYLNTSERKQWGQEYLPVEAVDNILDIKYKQESLLNEKTTAKVEILENDVPDMKFVIEDISGELELEFPRIYYLGYELVDDKGKSYELTRGTSGLIEAVVDKDGIYYLKYVGTDIDRVAYLVTGASFVLFFGYLIVLGHNKRRGAKNADK